MGQEASIISNCEKKGVIINETSCAVEFGSNGDVDSFGRVSRGGLSPNTDTAGKGLLIAFIIPNLILFLLGLTFALLQITSWYLRWKRGHLGKVYDVVDAAKCISARIHTFSDSFVLTTADAQLVLLIAFGVSMRLRFSCEMSLYHFLLALHLGIIGLVTASMTFLLVPTTMRAKTFKVLLRQALFVGCIGVLYSMLDVQAFRNTRDKIGAALTNLPAAEQRDSLLVLPAFCFLLTEKNDGFNPFPGFSQENKDHVMNTGPRSDMLGQVYLFLAVVCFVAISVVSGYFIQSPEVKQKIAGVDVKGASGTGRTSERIHRASKVIAWTLGLTTIIIGYVSILGLRSWMNGSGWIQLGAVGNNIENEIEGIGQLVPLFALLAIPFAILDLVVDVRGGDRTVDEVYRPQGFELGDMPRNPSAGSSA